MKIKKFEDLESWKKSRKLTNKQSTKQLVQAGSRGTLA
jgi:hypothetical protein